MKYKVGDTVKVTSLGRKRWYLNDFGKGYGVIVGIFKDDFTPYKVEWEGGVPNYYNEMDLEIFPTQLENIYNEL